MDRMLTIWSAETEAGAVSRDQAGRSGSRSRSPLAGLYCSRAALLTLGSALTLKQRTRRYELPEEKVIIG
ncbi:hypothetical protein [Nonomuraea salmonea]|jgi:hypothetical protein|uniref:Uncharacterized protein n=1 Tax=Nonomuraea salmonea TaxID=46181 RepID=A0ABV5NHY3_9ACTN